SYRKINTGPIRFEGGNRMIGGDMESVEAWATSKWISYKLQMKGLKADVSCDSVSARTGNSGMHIYVRKDGQEFPFMTEQPPIWMEIPIPVQTGELVCIQGWIRIPNDLTNTVDGLTISEDHGGPALGLRFAKATPWRPFAFYRYAAFTGTMKIKISMDGYGDVHLDDLAASVVPPEKK
ncbi:MAG: hypothetical protein Q4G59_10190, partial [Planctomycetia bacterium]|nr:hypothetical protein [Planctomycetia bacterium]